MPSVITPCGGGGGGIQFDTKPQAGNWLYVETTATSGTAGIELKASAELLFEGGGAITLTSAVSISFNAPDFLFTGDFSGTDDYVVNVGGNVLLNGGGANSIGVA